MKIFSSLGSNYDFAAVRLSIFRKDNPEDKKALTGYLEKKYRGKCTLFYKGREALAAALAVCGLPKGTDVCIVGYTCYAVYRAVISQGFKPIFLDVGEGLVNFTPDALERACKRSRNVRAVIVQNTLGFPCNSEKILQVAEKFNLTVIEDLAHAVGARYANGIEAGLIGDFTVLSFSQDKLIDGVSGGALIARTKQPISSEHFSFLPVSRQNRLRDRLYPLFTTVIRTTYPLPGKLFHAFFKKLRLLSTPMGNVDEQHFQVLPSWNARLALLSMEMLPDNLAHRRKIAAIYARTLKPEFLLPELVKEIARASAVRFPIRVINRPSLLAYLKKNGVYLEDIWYDAPVSPKKYLYRTSYAGECPTAEGLSDTMVNLPTHRNISEIQAMELAQLINVWNQ